MRVHKWPKDLKPILSACKAASSIDKVHALMLTASYIRIGDIDITHKVFDKSPKRGVDAWNAFIVHYSRQIRPVEVISLYQKMSLEEVRPDSSTFTIALKACAVLLNLEMGEEIWRRAVECGYGDDVFVASSVLNLYAKCGKMDEAVDVFEKMRRRDLVSWTTMITGFARSGRASEAVDVFRQMQKVGMEGDRIVMLGLIQACASIGDTRMGLSVHGCIIRRDLLMDVALQTNLVYMYAKNGSLELASCVFRKMHRKSGVSWSALISGYTQNSVAEDALELFIEMQCFGFKPDLVSLMGAVLACLPSRMSSRDSISWNAMISGYGIHGHGKEALSLFHRMKETNLKPDHTTFASLLSALSHSGLVEEGRYWFDLMITEFMIKPHEKHYACMIDLLARAGRVEEAWDLIDTMTYEPGIAVWVTLLSAEKVLELNPDNPGIYALVSNFCAAARKWDEVAGIRNSMKKTGMKKVPGYSVIEVNRTFHAFLMEDKNHRHNEQIVEILEKLEHEMSAVTLNPKTEFVLNDLKEEV
ncbi:hypothetical protein RJ639_014559 [Escallonia herrerae]|uniref:Pentatricopeptide repeat-containing protein n=1 Tax=Escallonia herrerae TaxID=1293975 RepID=A0AA88VHS4_9ASTE|nr:hypothetical protein RJ639_014559 [Escallonia herrerae]